MSVDQTKVIDSVNTTNDGKQVILPLYDHLGWNENEKEHMYLLQEKVKSYLDFVEMGTFEKMSPEHAGKPITILLVAKYSPPNTELINNFFEYLKNMVLDAGLKYEFSFSNL